MKSLNDFTLWIKILIQLTNLLINQVTSDLYGCKINTAVDLSPESSLILNPLNNDIILPDDYNTIRMNVGANLLLACPEGQFKNYTNKSVLKVKCNGDNLYGLDGENHKISHFDCEKTPQSVIKRMGKAYDGSIVHYKIGFNLKQEGFIKQYDLYFDEKNLIPSYTVHKLGRNFSTKYSSPARETVLFKKSPGFQGIVLKRVYKRSNQHKILNTYLPDTVAKKYTENNHILLRGSLIPKEDFPYTPQQTATLYNFNTAPQWRIFKYGNWKILNEGIRRLAEDRKTNILVYSGVHGVFNIYGIPIYMTFTSSGNGAIPVPSVFWKIVHDVDMNQAIVFLGCNDPFANQFNNATLQFCSKSLCNQLNWISFDINPLKGIMNCCSLNDFNKIIKFPKVEANSILLNKTLD